MSGKKFWIGAMLTVLSVILVYVSHGMVNAGKKQTYHSVAVILDDSSHDRWNSLKKGLEQAAEENHIHLNIVFTGLSGGGVRRDTARAGKRRRRHHRAGDRTGMSGAF